MEILDVSRKEYDKVVTSNKYIYDSSWFHEINGNKVDMLYYLLFRTNKYKCAIIVGVKNEEALFPYSAPFAMFEKINELEIGEMEEVICLLEKFLCERRVRKVFFRFPPMFYDESFISQIQNILIRKNYVISTYDLNYQYLIKDEDAYLSNLARNARKNLNRALKREWVFQHCNNEEQKEEAYNVIARNRKLRGYPLRMTWEAVRNTSAEIDNDFFLLKLNGKNVAAAIIFGVAKEIYQVIYWGDILEYTEDRPMNYLAYRVYLYYKEKGAKVLDIGPSTENSVPNYGLCSFKRSIGCDVSSKLTFSKELK